MAGKNQWVSPRPDGTWGVHGEGNTKDTGKFDSQKQAIDRAKSIAIHQKSEVVVQGTDGRIVSKDSYGNDPCPPKDTEH